MSARLDQDPRGRTVRSQLDLDPIQRQRVAQRNPLAGPLGGLDPRQPCGREHVAFRQAALEHLVEGLGRHS